MATVCAIVKHVGLILFFCYSTIIATEYSWRRITKFIKLNYCTKIWRKKSPALTGRTGVNQRPAWGGQPQYYPLREASGFAPGFSAILAALLQKKCSVT